MLAGSPRPVLGAARRAGRWLASSKGCQRCSSVRLTRTGASLPEAPECPWRWEGREEIPFIHKDRSSGLLCQALGMGEGDKGKRAGPFHPEKV